MTEQEEDEELLSDLNQAKKTVISFDESPPYIKVCDLMLLKLLVRKFREIPLNSKIILRNFARNSDSEHYSKLLGKW